MLAYNGQDAYSGEVGAYIPGKGYWVIPDAAQDSDDRDAATSMILAEGALDRTNWIGWRMVNGLEGGEYDGDITWNGTHTHAGQVFFSTYVQWDAAVLFGDDVQINGTLTLRANPVLDAGVDVTFSSARTWHRRARLRAVSLDSGVPQAYETISPLYAAPSILSSLGSANPVILYLEFDPPHDGTITAVEVRSVVNTNPVGAITRATYELVRWDHGLNANATSLSATATDAHAANGSDWNTVLTTNLSSISSSAIDRTHGYGVRITAGRVSGNSLDMWYDVLVTGTTGKISGL